MGGSAAYFQFNVNNQGVIYSIFSEMVSTGIEYKWLKVEKNNSIIGEYNLKMDSPAFGQIIEELKEYSPNVGVSYNEYLAKLACIRSFRTGKNPFVLDELTELYSEPFTPGELPGIKEPVRQGVMDFYGKHDITIGDFANFPLEQLAKIGTPLVYRIYRLLKKD